MENEARVITKQAATVEDAKALIAQELGLPQEKIAFEIVHEAGKKVFGLFGGSDAIVKGTPAGTGMTGEVDDTAKAYLTAVLEAMGAKDFTCEVKVEDDQCVISLNGEDLGFIIGRRGDTLDALQYLTSLVANRAGGSYRRVTLDIGNYREKREQALISLANRLGGQVARTGRRHSLEPMNPYERRIIHTAIQGMEGVTSWSVGSEPNRHVILGPSEDNPHKDQGGSGRSGRGGRGRRGGRSGERSGERRERTDRTDRGERREHEIVAPERPVREFISRSNPLPTADGATPPSRTESEKEDSAFLYGRIDL